MDQKTSVLHFTQRKKHKKRLSFVVFVVFSCSTLPILLHPPTTHPIPPELRRRTSHRHIFSQQLLEPLAVDDLSRKSCGWSESKGFFGLEKGLEESRNRYNQQVMLVSSKVADSQDVPITSKFTAQSKQSL